MGIGSARGEDRSVAAAEMAISSPLLEASIDGAHGVLLSVSGGSDLGLFEINEAANLVAQAAHDEANIIFGAVIDDALGDEVRVTVIAAGFDGGMPRRRDAGQLHRPETVRARSDAADGGKNTASDPSGGDEPGGNTDTADIPTPRSTGTVGSVGNGSGGVAEPAPAPAREPRRMMPPSNDDLDVPDFLK
jgi:cell division protein FtsZ